MILHCKTGCYEVPNHVLEAYLSIYPTGEQEFAAMVIWLEANPSRRPASPRSAPRFVANWFKRVPKRVLRPAVQQSDRAQRFAQLTGYSQSIEVIEHVKH